jgi:chromosomal replication initiation ATPase DnaA
VAGESIAPLEPVLDGIGPAGGVAVDDAERAPEVELLHLCNWCRERKTALLLLSRTAPGAWPFRLPDLASRIRSLPAIGISAPDDRLLGAVLIKHLADRGLRVAPGVIAYLLPRIERSFAAAAELVAALDRQALSAGTGVTIPLARRVLRG